MKKEIYEKENRKCNSFLISYNLWIQFNYFSVDNIPCRIPVPYLFHDHPNLYGLCSQTHPDYHMQTLDQDHQSLRHQHINGHV